MPDDRARLACDRRAAMQGASALAIKALAAGVFVPHRATAQRAAMTSNIVLIHGAWHGGWCWEPVRALLEAEGLTVHAPTLPGLAERADELDAAIGLDAHIADARNAIEQSGLTNFVLVGHSYGGMVITGLADALKHRITHIVYLDAAVPENGQSMISYGAPRPQAAIAATETALRSMAPDGIAMSPPPPALLGISPDHKLHDWTMARLTPHPLKTWFDPIALENGGSDGLPRTYIHCTTPVLAQTQFSWLAAKTAADPSWQYRALATGHDAMITDPDGVADLLLEAAGLIARPVANPVKP